MPFIKPPTAESPAGASSEGTPPEGRGKGTGKERSWVKHERDADWEAQHHTVWARQF